MKNVRLNHAKALERVNSGWGGTGIRINSKRISCVIVSIDAYVFL
jgi:hypothetical protein